VFLRLLLLFTIVPFVELAILLKLGDEMGWLETLGLIIATGVIGTILARQQGFEVIQRIRSELSSGKPPTDSLMDGLMILIASVLLITPGVLTDITGFLLLWPAFRARMRAAGKAYLMRSGSFRVFTSGPGGQFHETANPFQQSQPRRDAQGNEIIDVEYTKKSSDEKLETD